MTSTILRGMEEEAARNGFHKKRLPPDYRLVRWSIDCSRCKTNGSWGWKQNMAPEAMVKYARQKGWDVGQGMRPLCPACAHERSKAPLAKPNHQNFKPWVPPRTAIFDGLLVAAAEKTRKEERARAIDALLEAEVEIRRVDQEIADIKAEKRAAIAAQTEQDKLAARQARMRHAQAMKAERQRQEKAARDAGADALRRAQLLERCGTKIEEPTGPQPVNNAPQAEEIDMNTRPVIAPAPKITHAVFQCLDGIFDAEKRLYRNGYTDQKVARECGTTEEIVAYLRKETFGELAEDPRIGSIRDDLELLTLESTEQFAKLQKALAELRNRIEQVARS